MTAVLGVGGLWPHPFALIRRADPTGVSDTGRVATGVVWPDGRVTVRWDTGAPPAGFHRPVCQVEHFEEEAEMLAVHGHSGSTEMAVGDPLRPHPVWGLRWFAVLGAAAVTSEIWWWGVQWWGDWPAVTWRVATRYRSRHTPQIMYWPAGAAAALAELGDGLRPSSLRPRWLPQAAAELTAILPRPARGRSTRPQTTGAALQ